MKTPSQIEEAKTVECPICWAPKDEACVAKDGTEIKNGAHMGRISEFRRNRAER